jgi:urease beta subunit
MPVMQKETTIVANTANENILAGSAFEFLRRNAVVSIGLTGSATGLVANIQSGADIILEESPLEIKTSFPVIPDEMYYNDVGIAGDRLVIRVRNTTGGDLVVRAIVQVTNLRGT